MTQPSPRPDPPSMRVRRSRALLTSFEEGGAVGFNWFTKRRARVDAVAFALLDSLGAWCEIAALFDRSSTPRAELARELTRLVDATLVVIEGTDAAALDERLAQQWEWGASAGLFHFGIHDTAYASPEQIHGAVAARMAVTAPVELHAQPSPDALRLALPDRDHPLLAAMRARRSRRRFADTELPRAALRDCLFAGFAIVGFGVDDDPDAEPLPLKLSPSGGARNPFEAYVCARRVAGLAPGVYHYTGIDHALVAVDETPPPRFAGLLGGQSWFDQAGALILLVAHFGRTQRKYPHPGALRVVLLEAGHIAQNVLLAAGTHRLAAAPTCAVSDRALEQLCGLDPLAQAVVHVVALGVADDVPSPADFRRYLANPLVPGWLDEG
jgi:SagB-type dehydrogenase family enzyme